MSKVLTLNLPATALRWLAVGAGIGLLVAAAGAPNFAPRNTLAADPAAPEHTITVTGIGRVSIVPDVADLRIGVVVTRPTATEARSAAAAAMTKVVTAIKAAGIADKDIQTSMLLLQPVYDYSNNGQGKLIGFQLVNAVSVTVHAIDKVGALVDAAVTAGATSIDGVNFRVNDPTSAESQARTAAVIDARTKANALASAAGVSISGVSSIIESTSTVPYPVPYAASSDAMKVATPVQPGTTEIDVIVTIVYRIP